jgi:uncharacterized protein (TIGR02996 family)
MRVDHAPALLAVILAHPDDDAPRLILADWLEEHGDSARAEFIRVQMELARLDVDDHAIQYWDGQLGDGPDYYQQAKALRRRERELLSRWCVDWIHPFDQRDISGHSHPNVHFFDGTAVAFHRGFIHSVTLTAADWLAHSAAICASQPVERVTLTTPMPVTIYRDFANRMQVWSLPGRKAEVTVTDDVLETHFGWAVQAALMDLLNQEWSRIMFTLTVDDAEFVHHDG